MYTKKILNLNRNPLNFGKLKKFTLEKEKINELCGDKIKVQILIKNSRIKKIKFLGEGCAISMASASLITEKIKGMKIEEIKKLKENFIFRTLGFEPIEVRKKCALLCFKIIKEVLNENFGNKKS